MRRSGAREKGMASYTRGLWQILGEGVCVWSLGFGVCLSEHPVRCRDEPQPVHRHSKVDIGSS